MPNILARGPGVIPDPNYTGITNDRRAAETRIQATLDKHLKFMVRTAGLEPALPYEKQILSLLRLPFRHVRYTPATEPDTLRAAATR